MHIRKEVLCWLASLVLTGTGGLPLLGAQDTEPMSRRILKWSEADQIAWVNSYLREGASAPTEPLAMLVVNRSSLAVPILENEIENILHSTSPHELLSDPSADPQKVVNIAAGMIEYAGDEHSLEAASKLMKIDGTRFGDVVHSSLLYSGARRNPFTVAYRGFEIGDPEVDKRIVEWADERLKIGDKYGRAKVMQWWAEAMAEKYNGVPDASQWARDPIVSRLDPAKDAALHDEMLPLTAEAEQKRSKR
jgi:hypothetical protein